MGCRRSPVRRENRGGVAEGGEPVPQDCAKRKREFEVWLREVGWR
jgi:hypothetical protein